MERARDQRQFAAQQSAFPPTSLEYCSGEITLTLVPHVLAGDAPFSFQLAVVEYDYSLRRLRAAAGLVGNALTTNGLATGSYISSLGPHSA